MPEKSQSLHDQKTFCRCSGCGTFATFNVNGTVITHKRYADGAGWGPGKDRTMITCEGSNQPPEPK